MVLTVTTQKNVIKTFGTRTFFKHPYGLKEDPTVQLKLNSSEKVILCSRDTAAAYKLSGISLEYNAIFDKRYTTTIIELYGGTTSTPYTKVTS